MRHFILKITLSLAVVFGAQTAPAQSVDLSRAVTLPADVRTRTDAVRAIDALGYSVIYNVLALDSAPVAFGATTMPLSALLDKVVEGTTLTYTVDGNTIILHTDPSKQPAPAGRTLTGTVRNGEGAVRSGATVELLDLPGKSSRTNSAGRFRIAGVPSGSHIVKIGPAGGARYREVTVSARGDTDVILVLDDIVIPTDAPQPVAAPRETQTTSYFHITPERPVSRPASRYIALPDPAGGQYLPKAGVKTNLLYLGTTTLNAAVEFGLARRWTLDASVVFNPFKLDADGVNRLWFAQPELRYWFCQRFEKSFIGLHGIYGQFNIGQVDFLTDTFRDHRYMGWGAGAGVSYGYHLPMGRRWAWEFTVGAGYVYLEYDKYRCYECDEFVARKNLHYFGPTKAAVSLIFMIR